MNSSCYLLMWLLFANASCKKKMEDKCPLKVCTLEFRSIVLFTQGSIGTEMRIAGRKCACHVEKIWGPETLTI